MSETPRENEAAEPEATEVDETPATAPAAETAAGDVDTDAAAAEVVANADDSDADDLEVADAPIADEAPAAAGAPAAETETDADVAVDEDEELAEAEAEAEAAPAVTERPQRRARLRRSADEATSEAPTPAPTAPKRQNGRVVVRAHAKYVRSSARKSRLVADQVRGKSVQEARAILAHTSRSVARDWSKLLESAVANAEHNHELVGDDLRIHAITADEGPTLKRFRPRAMGRATRIRKRTSHLTIQLTPKETR